MSKVLGYEIKQGVFTSKDNRQIAYNNLVIYIASDTLSIEKNEKGEIIKYGIGSKAESVKTKNTPENLKEVFGLVPDEQFLRSSIGHDVNIYFNQYGNVCSVMFPNEGQKS